MIKISPYNFEVNILKYSYPRGENFFLLWSIHLNVFVSEPNKD